MAQVTAAMAQVTAVIAQVTALMAQVIALMAKVTALMIQVIGLMSNQSPKGKRWSLVPLPWMPCFTILYDGNHISREAAPEGTVPQRLAQTS